MGVGIISKSLDLLKGGIFLKIFTPSDYGLIDIINQIINMSKFADIGLLGNVQREYNVDSKINKEEAEKKKDIAFGMDIIFTVILSTIILISILFLDYSFKVKVGVLFGIIALLANKGLKIFKLQMTITEKFKDLILFNLLNNLSLNIPLILSVFFIGIYAPLILKPIILLFILVFWWNREKFKFKFKFHYSFIKSHIKYGGLLSLMSLLLGSWIFLERFLITNFFSLTELGIYASCLFLIKVGTSLLDEFIKPYSIKVKKSLSSINIDIIKKYVVLPSIIFFFGSLFIIFLSQKIIFWLETNFLSNYTGIGNVFLIISWLIPIYGIGSISGYLIFTKGIDRFKEVFYFYIFRFLFIFFLCYIYPPDELNQLLLYFLIIEYLFFYTKQFLIYTKFFELRRVMILFFFLTIHAILIANNEEVHRILF